MLCEQFLRCALKLVCIFEDYQIMMTRLQRLGKSSYSNKTSLYIGEVKTLMQVYNTKQLNAMSDLEAWHLTFKGQVCLPCLARINFLFSMNAFVAVYVNSDKHLP